jgi:hypothetical protein
MLMDKGASPFKVGSETLRAGWCGVLGCQRAKPISTTSKIAATIVDRCFFME